MNSNVTRESGVIDIKLAGIREDQKNPSHMFELNLDQPIEPLTSNSKYRKISNQKSQPLPYTKSSDKRCNISKFQSYHCSDSNIFMIKKETNWNKSEERDVDS